MSIHYNVKPPAGMCFCFDGLNKKCYSGSGLVFKDLISGASATAVVGGSQSIGIVDGHLRFSSLAVNRAAYIPFASANINVPNGWHGSWSWFQYYQDSGEIDHPNFGKETGAGWDGVGGFVFGNGWSVDGPRWGIGGVAYGVYTATPTDYVANIWQCWTVTYNGAATNGLKTYLNGVLIDQRTPAAVPIGVSTAPLFIGATNNRGGNWNGNMDLVQMWRRELSAKEVRDNFNVYRGRFGL